jgi:hypothetical protein
MSNPFSSYKASAAVIADKSAATRKYDTFIDVSSSVSADPTTGELTKLDFRIKISRRKHIPGAKRGSGIKPEVVALSQTFKYGACPVAEIARKAAIVTLGTSVWENQRGTDRGELMSFSPESIAAQRQALLATEDGRKMIEFFDAIRNDGDLPAASSDGFWVPVTTKPSGSVDLF